MNTRGLRNGVDMKKKVKAIGIGALGSNLTENFKTDQGWLHTCSRRVHRQEEAQYQGLLSIRQEKRRRRRPEGGEIGDVRTLRVGCYLVYILTQKCQCTAIVFTEKCSKTPFLACMLQNLGIKAIALHGQMSQDYIHRVGRTACAGRSGLAISLVNQYECGNLQKVESLIGKKLPEHRATVEEVMQLSESVKEATRLATKKIKESGEKKRKWGGDDDDDDAEEDVLKYSTHMDRKSKKCKRGYQ
ncbi:hypothetical protein ACLB2K_061827 [Fragaria x ananassa]